MDYSTSGTAKRVAKMSNTERLLTAVSTRCNLAGGAMLSPGKEFAGRRVLLTGALGMLGSVVLEQLLRLTQVEEVFLLVRGKKQVSASQRVAELLQCPLFHLLHKQALEGENVFNKVHVVEGDLMLPGLGLSPENMQQLQQVDYVLHCAASVELQPDMQTTLRTNYLGTQQLMHLASGMPNLLAFVHVSTYYTCNHLPRNSLVKEQLYPLQLSLDGGATRVSYAEFAAALLAMRPAAANAVADAVMQANNFGSRYAFGKSLTEQLVADDSGLPIVIVRPALICNMAGSPWPGYVQGYAGPGGYGAAYGMGFFQGLDSVAYGSDQLVDVIPCDTVAALILAAAAAQAADTLLAPAAASNTPTIYHAASSKSYPLPIADLFGYMADYWSANPPPLRLPLTRYVRISRPHTPTLRGTQRGHRRVEAKARLLAAVLRLAGQGRLVRKLLMGVQSFTVQNSLPLAASMVCAVDNVVQLRDRISSAERPLWPLLWAPGEPSAMPWRTYLFTALSGVRQLLLGMRNPENTHSVCHPGRFRMIAPCSEAVRSLVLSSIGNPETDVSSTACSTAAGDVPDITVVATDDCDNDFGKQGVRDQPWADKQDVRDQAWADKEGVRDQAWADRHVLPACNSGKPLGRVMCN